MTANSSAIVEETANSVASCLERRTPLALLEGVAEALRRIETCADASPDRPRRACRAGCSSCCYLAVSITGPEALLIAQRLREAQSEGEIERLAAKLRDTSARVSHLTIEQRARARVPCALLNDAGECTIHPFRPIGCRGWTSFAQTDCDAALRADQPGHSGPMDAELWRVAGATTEGLERAVRSVGWDAGQYELHAALLRALEVDAMGRFLAGDSVFAGCGRVTSDALRWVGVRSSPCA